MNQLQKVARTSVVVFLSAGFCCVGFASDSNGGRDAPNVGSVIVRSAMNFDVSAPFSSVLPPIPDSSDAEKETNDPAPAPKPPSPLTLSILPGADASFLLYEDDGISFEYRSGDWMGITMTWNDARRTLELKLSPGSRMLSPSPRMMDLQLRGEQKSTHFEGKPISITFPK